MKYAFDYSLTYLPFFIFQKNLSVGRNFLFCERGHLPRYPTDAGPGSATSMPNLAARLAGRTPEADSPAVYNKDLRAKLFNLWNQWIRHQLCKTTLLLYDHCTGGCYNSHTHHTVSHLNMFTFTPSCLYIVVFTMPLPNYHLYTVSQSNDITFTFS